MSSVTWGPAAVAGDDIVAASSADVAADVALVTLRLVTSVNRYSYLTWQGLLTSRGSLGV